MTMKNITKSISKQFLAKSRVALDVTHSLATGPNKYKSKFGRVLEGVFRKDYFTLQTMVVLTDMVERDNELGVVFGGSILDLSRRVFEDMIFMEYVKASGKTDKYVRQFFDYVAIERKKDLDFLLERGGKVSKKIASDLEDDYKKTPTKLRKNHNWLGQNVEQIIFWLTQNGTIEELQKTDILKIYTAGNRKNHTSPSDIVGHLFQQTLDHNSETDLEMGLMITHGAMLRVALLLIEEIEVGDETKEALMKCWKSINEE